jgi:acetyl-CoA C-acetyltransferase
MMQMHGSSGANGSPRQIASIDRGRKLALTHNLGGAPGECVSFVSVVGSEPSA